MSNGKGSKRRQFNKQLEDSYKVGHRRTYGLREKVDGRKTKIVIRGGKLVVDDGRHGWIGLDPATDPPTVAEVRL